MDNGYTTYSDCNYNFTGKKMNKLQKDLAILYIAFGVSLLTMLVIGILIVTVLV